MERSYFKYKSNNNVAENNYFICGNCETVVQLDAIGTNNRNHCPHCLCSLHVDLTIGDRKNCCKGVMFPITIWARNKGEWSIVHKCSRCGTLRTNRIAGDDNEELLLELANKPMKSVPFK